MTHAVGRQGIEPWTTRLKVGCQHPGWFILHARKAAGTIRTGRPAHRLAGEPGPWPVHLPWYVFLVGVRREGFEPSRPKALIPETSVSACFHHQRLRADTGYRTRGLDLGKVALYP